MKYADIRQYYDERYRSDQGESFPYDPARYRGWFGPLLETPRPVGTMLDFGCGVGYACTAFADLGYEVTGVDISPVAIGAARDREPRGTFQEATPNGSLPFPDASFDVVACLGVIEHVPEPGPIVAELRRVARPGATGIWVVPNARSPFFWFGHGTEQLEEHPRSLDGWRTLFVENGWRIESVRRDPGPKDRPVSAWKKLALAGLNRLPLSLTYQFVIETRPA